MGCEIEKNRCQANAMSPYYAMVSSLVSFFFIEKDLFTCTNSSCTCTRLSCSCTKTLCTCTRGLCICTNSSCICTRLSCTCTRSLCTCTRRSRICTTNSLPGTIIFCYFAIVHAIQTIKLSKKIRHSSIVIF